jgi:chromate transporter
MDDAGVARHSEKHVGSVETSYSEGDNAHPSLHTLFIAFLRLGITAFGGPAMVAYIRKMAVERNKWLDDDSFRAGVALCQVVPGATAMQMAAYVGLKVHGVSGAVSSFVGFGLPACLLMMTLSALYAKAHTLPMAISAFNGLQAIIVAIVANATLTFGRSSLKNLRDVIIAAAGAGVFGLGVNPIAVILLTAFLGLLLNHGEPQRQTKNALDNGTDQRSSVWLAVFIAVLWFALLYLTNRKLFDLATIMARIDLFAFGGGFASVPLMYHEIVSVRSWLDGPTFMNGIVLGQATPGPIVITATFVGYLLYGFLGGLVATISVFLPSFLIVVGLAPHIGKLRASPHFNKAISGILCSFVGLLLTVTIDFALKIPWDLPRILLTSAAFLALLLKIDLLWIVSVGVSVSLLIL